MERCRALLIISSLAEGTDIDAFNESMKEISKGNVNTVINVNATIDAAAGVYVSLMTIIVIANPYSFGGNNCICFVSACPHDAEQQKGGTMEYSISGLYDQTAYRAKPRFRLCLNYYFNHYRDSFYSCGARIKTATLFYKC